MFLPEHYRTAICDTKHQSKFHIFDKATSFYDFEMLPEQLRLLKRSKNICKEEFSLQKVSVMFFKEFGPTCYKNNSRMKNGNLWISSTKKWLISTLCPLGCTKTTHAAFPVKSLQISRSTCLLFLTSITGFTSISYNMMQKNLKSRMAVKDPNTLNKLF